MKKIVICLCVAVVFSFCLVLVAQAAERDSLMGLLVKKEIIREQEPREIGGGLEME